MNSSLSPVSRRSPSSSVRICRCVGTSRALSGSSHTSRRGFEDHGARDADALALAARELVRDNGRQGRRRAPPGAAFRRGSRARLRGRAPDDAPAAARRRSRRPSCAGRGLPRGSWKTICSSRRSARSSRGVKREVLPPHPHDPPPEGRSSASTARARVDFPPPDSPTTPSASPAASSKPTPRSARRRAGDLGQPRRTANSTLTSASASAVGRGAACAAATAAAGGAAARTSSRV